MVACLVLNLIQLQEQRMRTQPFFNPTFRACWYTQPDTRSARQRAPWLTCDTSLSRCAITASRLAEVPPGCTP